MNSVQPPSRPCLSDDLQLETDTQELSVLTDCCCLRRCWLENAAGRAFYVTRMSSKHFISFFFLNGNCRMGLKARLSLTDMSKLIFLN